MRRTPFIHLRQLRVHPEVIALLEQEAVGKNCVDGPESWPLDFIFQKIYYAVSLKQVFPPNQNPCENLLSINVILSV